MREPDFDRTLAADVDRYYAKQDRTALDDARDPEMATGEDEYMERVLELAEQDERDQEDGHD